MNTFVNYVGGIVSFNSYRNPTATITTLHEVMEAVENFGVEALCASITGADLADPLVAKFIAIYSDDTVDMPIKTQSAYPYAPASLFCPCIS